MENKQIKAPLCYLICLSVFLETAVLWNIKDECQNWKITFNNEE